MALTLRSNGSGGGIVSAAWWNDYYDLLTGVMTDQIVTLKTDVILEAIGGTAAAPTLTLAAGTVMGVGSYQYLTTNLDGNGGETLAGTSASITTTTNNQEVALSAIALGPTGTASRNIYRTKVGGSTFYLLHNIADNTTQTYTDATADTSLGTQVPPQHPTFGGSLSVKDSGGTVRFQVASDGAILASPGLPAKLGVYDTSGGLGVPGASIYIGTTDPATVGGITVNNGDIWIKV